MCNSYVYIYIYTHTLTLLEREREIGLYSVTLLFSPSDSLTSVSEKGATLLSGPIAACSGLARRALYVVYCLVYIDLIEVACVCCSCYY